MFNKVFIAKSIKILKILWHLYILEIDNKIEFTNKIIIMKI